MYQNIEFPVYNICLKFVGKDYVCTEVMIKFGDDCQWCNVGCPNLKNNGLNEAERRLLCDPRN